MENNEELELWKAHLRELEPIIKEQYDWELQGKVVASVSPACPEKLREVAERLVALQNSVGEYKRNQIPNEDVERIKYFSKQLKIGFDDVIKLAVKNSRYVSKSAIEARGILSHIKEIDRVYNEYYPVHGVFPINAMKVESKRTSRSIDIQDRIRAIVEVFFPEIQEINIVERDYAVAPQTKPELTEEELKGLCLYFKSMAEDGTIDKCFIEENQREFLECCKIIEKSNMTLDEFLKKYTGLTYTKCFAAEIVPAVKQMVSSYQRKFRTTKRIRENDPYLRSKIDAAEREVGKYSVRELLSYWQIPSDNEWDGKSPLSNEVLLSRQSMIVERLKNLYPDGVIEKEFITKYPALYEELKLLANRLGRCGIDDYLKAHGFSRESYHAQQSENVIYLSDRDMLHYEFDSMLPADFDECKISELNPRTYYGVYSKLIGQGMDSIGLASKHAKEKTE